MKRIVLLSTFSLVATVCNGQEWLTSFDVAKRLARVENKMLFVLWENSFNYSIPLFTLTDDDKASVIDIAKDTSFDTVIWEYFVPVKLQESEYSTLSNDAKGRGYNYLNKLNDESVKIMDINGHILNVDDNSNNNMNLTFLISNYAINTSFLSSYLKNYYENQTFLTAMLLSIRYMDFAVFADEQLRPELIALATIYLDESEKFVSLMGNDRKKAYVQKIELVRIKELLILNDYKKAYRQLKRIEESQIDSINNPLFVFLNYTIFKLLKNELNADLWKSKISSLDLKMADLILKNNKNGSTN